MDRRNFFRSGGRVLILGGLAAGATFLAVNGQIKDTGTCGVASQCNGCSKLSACKEDQAVEFQEKTGT